jgi:hypothetical protein
VGTKKESIIFGQSEGLDPFSQRVLELGSRPFQLGFLSKVGSGRRSGARQAGQVALLATQIGLDTLLEEVDFRFGEAAVHQAGEEEVEVGVDVDVTSDFLCTALHVDRVAVAEGDFHDDQLISALELLLDSGFRHDESQDRSESRVGLSIHGISES